MITERNACSLGKSREMPSGLQLTCNGKLFYPSKNALFSEGTMNAETHTASEENVKVIQGRVAPGTLYIRLTIPTIGNRHIKLPNSYSKELLI